MVGAWQQASFEPQSEGTGREWQAVAGTRQEGILSLNLGLDHPEEYELGFSKLAQAKDIQNHQPTPNNASMAIINAIFRARLIMVARR